MTGMLAAYLLVECGLSLTATLWLLTRINGATVQWHCTIRIVAAIVVPITLMPALGWYGDLITAVLGGVVYALLCLLLGAITPERFRPLAQGLFGR